MKLAYIEGEAYPYYYLPALQEAGLRHQFIGQALNFKPSHKEASVNQVQAAFLPGGMPLVEVHQVHGRELRRVTATELTGDKSFYSLGDFDGLMTNSGDIALLIKTADCIPIILFDPVKHVFALVHSGWLGTLQGIGQEALKQMCQTYGTCPEDLMIVYGPSLNMEDFQVKADVYQRFQVYEAECPQAFQREDHDHWLIDTKEINKQRFLQMGVPVSQQYDLAVSTLQDERLHSYRRQGKEAYGLNGLVAYLAPGGAE